MTDVRLPCVKKPSRKGKAFWIIYYDLIRSVRFGMLRINR